VKNNSSFGAKAPPFSDAQKPKKKKDITIETPPTKDDSKDKVDVPKGRRRGRPPKKQNPTGRSKTGKPVKGGGKDEVIEIDKVDDNEGEEKIEEEEEDDSDYTD
jgi:hypothetical protein